MVSEKLVHIFPSYVLAHQKLILDQLLARLTEMEATLTWFTLTLPKCWARQVIEHSCIPLWE